MALPRTTEHVIRGRLKFRVGRLVYLAFERHETILGFAFPKELRAALITSEPYKYLMPGRADLRYNWALVRIEHVDEAELRDLIVDAWSMVVPKSVVQAYKGSIDSELSQSDSERPFDPSE